MVLSREQILYTVIDIINIQFGVNYTSENTVLVDDLGADSLDTVELVMEIEEAFDLKPYLLEDEIDLLPEKIITVRDIVDTIYDKL